MMDGGFKYEEGVDACTEDSYPYEAKNGICRASTCTVGVPKHAVVDYMDVDESDDEALMEAVAQQPVSVAIEADKLAFQLYKGGVLDGECGTALDHGVLAVGYGEEEGKKYWLVKNSWGPQWGEEGYIKILRGEAGQGMCGINTQPSYPKVRAAPGPSPGLAPSPGPAPPSPPPAPAASHAFDNFIQEFGKIYDEAEKEVRFAAFAANYAYIQAENAKGRSYKLGINQFADMTPDEFSMSAFGLRPRETKRWGTLPSLGKHVRGNATLPTSVDWREKGAVTQVKNQAQCGACWAFSTTGALEGAWQIASGSLVTLSEQQLVDCSRKEGNLGCKGGMMDGGFKYEEGVDACTEDSYPYEAKNGICRASTCTVGVPKHAVVGYMDVDANDDE